MPQNMHVVEGILNIAFRVAESRSSSKEDIALGIIAALRRIHAAVAEAHEGVALAMRATLRDIIIAHNLQCLRETKILPRSAPLPEPGRSSARVAVAVLEDAANSSLAFNALTPNNECIDLAVRLLMQRLIAVVGGAPDYGALVDRIAGTAVGPPSVLVVPQGPQPTIN